MLYYLNLWWAFFLNKLTREMEFRTHFVLLFFIDTAWYAVQLSSASILFLYTESLGGLSRSDMLLFLGTLFVIDAINMILVSSSYWEFPSQVTSGNLDFSLTKPTSTIFLSLFRYPNVASVLNLLSAVCVLAYAVIDSPKPIDAFQWLQWSVLVVTGTIINLSFNIFWCAIAVLMVNGDGVTWLSGTIHQLGERPDTIYSKGLQTVFRTFVPFALIASVPAMALIGTLTPFLFVLSVVVAALSIIGTSKFFNWSLRFYQGASA